MVKIGFILEISGCFSMHSLIRLSRSLLELFGWKLPLIEKKIKKFFQAPMGSIQPCLLIVLPAENATNLNTISSEKFGASQTRIGSNLRLA
jgi:hypothetical protein